jgi:hypothetical protein
MPTWKWLAMAGLGAGIVGALVLASAQSRLFDATNQADGILEKDRAAAGKRNRIGWTLIVIAFAFQLFSILAAP